MILCNEQVKILKIISYAITDWWLHDHNNQNIRNGLTIIILQFNGCSIECNYHRGGKCHWFVKLLEYIIFISSIDKKPINYWFETKVYQLKYVIFTTGIEQNATVAHTKLEQNIMKVDIRSQSPNYFKPGLTYHGKVK